MIAFSCSHCGMKLQVKTEFAGRSTRCPTCKNPLVVPRLATLAVKPPSSRIDGPLSSLAQAGIAADVTLPGRYPGESSSSAPPVADVLRTRSADGQRYLLEGELARGGMGAVLRAIDCDIRREVAVKYLLDQSDPRKKARFVEEAQITGQLEHPNIVPIHELGVDARKHLYFSMKMVRGRSLQQVLQELTDQPRSAEKEYPLSRLLTIFINVCHALAYAHSRGVVHRDLKPANIMIGDFGEVYVMDWGLAKVLSPEGVTHKPASIIGSTPSFAWADAAASGSSSGTVKTSRDAEEDKTMDGTVMGTPLYMPPEQALGDIAAIDARSDIYSLGAVLYEMLTLLPPLDKSGGFQAILMRVAQGEIVPPQERVPARSRYIPPELAAVTMKALAKDKKDRYPSVEALRRDIELYLEGRSVSAREDSLRERLWKFARRNKGFSAGMATTFLVLLCSMLLLGKAWLATSRAYADYRQAEEDKRVQAKKSVPAFVRAARLAINDRQLDDALAQVSVAVDIDPDSVEARLLRAQLLITRQEYAEASEQLRECLQRQPNHAEAKQLAALCARTKKDDWPTLLAFAEVFERGRCWTLADVLLADLKTVQQGRAKLLEVYRKRIDAAWKGAGQNLGLSSDGTFTLYLDNRQEVSDLSPLSGMPLTDLRVSGCVQVRDLSPLKGMPLTRLDFQGCGEVQDLAPLQGMPLTFLRLNNCGQVPDLSPLKGMPLTKLELYECGQVRDLSPLKGMPLTELQLHWFNQVHDLSPLAGMPLTSLQLSGCVQVRDLAPLKGMPLTFLCLNNCDQVRDLSPLKGLPLTSFALNNNTQVHDLAPLKDLPLTSLDLGGCGLANDLSILKGMKLTSLNLAFSRQLTDLSPLKGMNLTHLGLDGCDHLRDLSPLTGMPLTHLRLGECDRVRDLAPLAKLSLADIVLPPQVDRGMEVLRHIKTLKKINTMTATDFWKKYDAGEFKQLRP